MAYAQDVSVGKIPDLQNWKSKSGKTTDAVLFSIDEKTKKLTLLIPKEISFDDLDEDSIKLARKIIGERMKAIAGEKLAKTKAEKERKETEKAELIAKEKAKENLAKSSETKKPETKGGDEVDKDGLVLFRDTMKGINDSFGGKITGVVENRRRKKLGYVQITFILLDESGAQVGSAVANTNGLEPGTKWKFEANSLGVSFHSYKLNELSGF